MIPFDWSRETVCDPAKLADYVELTAAFFEDEYQGSFKWSDFQQGASENILDDSLRTYVLGDEADEFSAPYTDMLNLVEQRAAWLGESYPFTRINSEVIFSPSQSTSKPYLPYLMLLICTYHNDASYSSSELQNGFEDVCKLAMQALFPDYADVFLFSQNSDDRLKLGWSARKAIPALAQKLNSQVVPEAQIPDTQREFGIDLIAICGFDDFAEYPLHSSAQMVGKET